MGLGTCTWWRLRLLGRCSLGLLLAWRSDLILCILIVVRCVERIIEREVEIALNLLLLTLHLLLMLEITALSLLARLRGHVFILDRTRFLIVKQGIILVVWLLRPILLLLLLLPVGLLFHNLHDCRGLLDFILLLSHARVHTMVPLHVLELDGCSFLLAVQRRLEWF